MDKGLNDMKQRTLIITGGSSGIGLATANLFASQGYTVYELSRHGQSHDGIKHIDCDVTSVEACQQAVSAIDQEISTSGGVGAWNAVTLVSNAGMGISGAVEFSKPHDIRRQFDVNFFGAVNISQAVLPYMRKAAEKTETGTAGGRGRIIFVSSMMAIFALPFQAFYSASKFAIDGYALALKNEVRPFGIKVCCLLPGDVKTGFTDARKKDTEGIDVYPQMAHAVETMEHDEQNGISPERMAQKVLSLAKSSNPELLSTVGWMYKAYFILNRFVPTSWAYKIISWMY